MTYTGITVFGNAAAEFPLDYDPNQIVVEDAKNLLSRTYEVRDLGLDRAAIMAGVQENYTTIDLSNTGPLVQAQLEKFVKPGTVDLIVVFDGSLPNPVSALSVTNSGTGLYSMWQHSGGPAICKTDGADLGAASCSSGVIAPFEVFDGRTFKEIALTYDGQMSGPEADFVWTGDTYDALSPAYKAELDDIGKQALSKYVTLSLMGVQLPI